MEDSKRSRRRRKLGGRSEHVAIGSSRDGGCISNVVLDINVTKDRWSLMSYV